jgi:hypothetical protein
MQQSPLRRSVLFLGFSIAVAMFAFVTGDSLTAGVQDLGLLARHTVTTAQTVQNSLTGGNTCVIFRFVAS